MLLLFLLIKKLFYIKIIFFLRVESVRDTPIRANVGHPVTMTKSLVR